MSTQKGTDETTGFVVGPKGIRFHLSTMTCTHMNGDVCRACDFDRYYARIYDLCPWREGDDPDVYPEVLDGE